MSNGMYVGVRYDEESMAKISGLAHEYGVPNAVSMGTMHSTIVYSRSTFQFEKDRRQVSYYGWATHLEIWRDGNKNILVLILDMPDLEVRHKHYLLNGATHDYENYVPHITLSYDIGDWQIPSSFEEFRVRANLEYIEELKLDWGT